MPATPSRTFLAAALLISSTLAPAPSHAVDVLAAGGLGGHDGGPIILPIYDADFGTWVKARVTTEVGKVSSVVPRGGAVELSWTPPEDFAGGPVSFLVRYKDGQGAKQLKTFTLDVPAAATVPIAVTADPAVVAPDVKEVTLRWSAPPSGQDPQKRLFSLKASSGDLGPVEVAPDGTASAVWRRPPGIESPVMALITVVDSTDSRRRGRLELPIQVLRSTTFQVPSDASVSVQLGDDTIGPKQASPAGTVAFDLRLDPRIRKGHLTGRTPHGEEVDQVVDLPELASPVVTLAMGQSPQVSTSPVPVAAAVWSLDNSVESTLTASSGKLARTPATDGWIEGVLTLDVGFEGTVALTATAEDVNEKGEIAVISGIPAVSAVANPAQLKSGQRNVTITASPVDALQRPVADTVGMVPLDGAFAARPVRRGDATTAKFLKDREADTLVVLTEPPGSVAGEPVAAIVPWLVPIREDQVVLRVAAVDPAGRTIANVPLSVAVKGTAPEGLPTVLKTDGYGFAHATFTAPDGALGIQIEGGGRSGGVAIAPDGTPLTGGDARWLTLQKVWMAVAPTVEVGNEAPVAVAAVVPTTLPTSSDAPLSASPQEPPPSSGPQPAPKARQQSSESAWLRGAVALQGTTLTYSSITEDSTIGPLGATLEDAGVTGGGLAAHVLAWPGQGAWGVEADVRYEQATLSPELTFGTASLTPEDFEGTGDLDEVDGEDAFAALTGATDSQTFERSALDLRVGVRYRAALAGPLTGYGLVQLQRQNADVFLWDTGEVADANPTLLGARLGGGAMVEAGPVWLDVQIAETLAPYPIRFEAEGRVQANLTSAIAIHAGGGMAWRTMQFSIDESDLTVKDQQASFMLGLATSLR